MSSYLVRRLVRFGSVFLLVTLAVTFMLDLSGTSPAYLLAGEGASDERIAQIAALYGFDDPPHVRYGRWLGDLFAGDLGTSTRTNIPVVETLQQRLPVTLQLAGMALLIAYGAAVPLAMYCALHRRSLVDRALTGLTAALNAVPVFVIGLVLAYVVAIQLELVPVLGWSPISEGFGANLRSALLPAISLAIPDFVIVQRVLRADAAEVLDEDYIQFARAKGLRTRTILFRHALRPASFSLLTLFALSVGRLLGGAIVIEVLFSLPGLGSLIPDAVTGNDLVLVQGIVAVIALAYLLANFVADVLYEFLDPRVRTR